MKRVHQKSEVDSANASGTQALTLRGLSNPGVMRMGLKTKKKKEKREKKPPSTTSPPRCFCDDFDRRGFFGNFQQRKSDLLLLKVT